MKAYLVKQPDGSFLDAVVWAKDENDAKTFLKEVGACEIGEIPPNVANSMGVPERHGRHNGALSRWIVGPTTIFGDLIQPRDE